MGKIIVITGTRKGIGKYLSEYYLQQGNIVCGCSRSSASIQNGNYRHFELDVSDEMAVVNMIRAVKKEFNTIDILLNNAGIASMNHILTTSYKTAQNIFNTNVFGSFLFLREVAKVMILQSKKMQDVQECMPFRIVNFSSVATPLRLEGEAIYAASKAALVYFTQICAKELSEFGISVNAVGPTPIRTDLIKNVPQEKMQTLLQKQAIKRFGTFDDVLNVIEFFLNKRSNFITGEVIYLGGVNG
ncbi:SDR family NAD(P)-dependent oxidoreductase [Campylobacter sp. MIT 21-1685]|uniref:SDR family NAD(P)-dependent oxidoreductase n=1 Tax=unclassified Campylobacter TaxID=2593542 RepID=UPI00224AC5B8|nr:MULTISPECIES: SDR family oxidoreductase [unclassified Campylobacter]MCX2683648.1 SDR family NAD(P)-dependent oxidoreductase [Campylobacter sp. MIT 21-1684]MCX2751952.1 SDR family NAD(P)-dependent oxidoreductase [Campylobacter sp. MIT 21-1682]MCX2808152.1 SDR family NAD(P)-dependent oxidoreductase [Campylobacter sp. MIT 21-1685]